MADQHHDGRGVGAVQAGCPYGGDGGIQQLGAVVPGAEGRRRRHRNPAQTGQQDPQRGDDPPQRPRVDRGEAAPGGVQGGAQGGAEHSGHARPCRACLRDHGGRQEQGGTPVTGPSVGGHAAHRQAEEAGEPDGPDVGDRLEVAAQRLAAHVDAEHQVGVATS